MFILVVLILLFLSIPDILHLSKQPARKISLLDLVSFLGTLAKLRKVTISVVMSVCLSVRPHGTTRFSLDGFSLNFIFEYYMNICWVISTLIKI